MSKLASSLPGRRLTPAVQTALIRAYKVVGLLALCGILIGLICFLTVNLFYMVNRSWVRPVILSPTHGQVLASAATLSQESSRRDELIGQRDELKAELDGIDRIVQLDGEFQQRFADVMNLDRPPGTSAVVAQRAYGESVIERERSLARKQVIGRQLQRLDAAVARYDRLIAQIKSSAYIQATDRQVTAAFVPYENRDNVAKGDPIFACRWGLALCRRVGKIGETMKGEVTDQHPQSGDSMRGIMVEIHVDDGKAAEERALFVGKKPFWIL